MPPFPEGVTTEPWTLSEGDYTTPPLLHLVRIERKNGADFSSSMTRDRERFVRECERLRAFRFRLVVVEADLVDYLRGRYGKASPSSIVGSIASLYVRFGIPVLFAHDAATCGAMIAGILRRLEDEYSKRSRAA